MRRELNDTRKNAALVLSAANNILIAGLHLSSSPLSLLGKEALSEKEERCMATPRQTGIQAPVAQSRWLPHRHTRHDGRIV